MKAAEILKRVRKFADAEATSADRSSHEWAKEFPKSEQSAYRAGMWYAYRQIQNLLPPQESMT